MVPALLTLLHTLLTVPPPHLSACATLVIPTSTEVATLPTALVHLHLDTLETGHPQVNMLHSFLKGYFPEGGYHFSQLPFNLATPKSMDVYQKAASKLADTC
ncbi:hypothetical protein EDC04DRAFT_2606619 [Pisolithus marmoratus]|nr:hypothetical protein EDC04DRAFT_2606619 [Pisolithus marmoratus]